MVSVLRFFFWS